MLCNSQSSGLIRYLNIKLLKSNVSLQYSTSIFLYNCKLLDRERDIKNRKLASKRKQTHQGISEEIYKIREQYIISQVTMK